jgi:hypothetical protein
MDGLDEEGRRGGSQLHDKRAKAHFGQREGNDRALGCQAANQAVVVRQWRGRWRRLIVFGPLLSKRPLNILLLTSRRMRGVLMMMMQRAQRTSQQIG